MKKKDIKKLRAALKVMHRLCETQRDCSACIASHTPMGSKEPICLEAAMSVMVHKLKGEKV